MKIRIIRSNPAKGQDGIEDLIGQVFKVLAVNKDWENKPDGTLTVDHETLGSIVIQKSEYETVES